jgi:H+/Cl- antiporter ClcA
VAPSSPRPPRRELTADLLRSAWTDHRDAVRFLTRWLVLGSVVGVLAGTSAAVFLYGLQLVTAARVATPALLFALPLGGFAIGWLYHVVGGRSAGGNDLILDEVHGLDVARPVPAPTERYVPRRLAPLVLLGTWVTHLFGGSAGREGTAIQMSASLADGFARLIRLRGDDRRLLLIAAISGGFGSVFSVPLAGAVFGLEVQSVGRLRYDAIVPALTASVVGNVVFHAIDLPHDVTPAYLLPDATLAPATLGKVVVAAVAFGLLAALFAVLTDGIRRAFTALIAWPPLRPAVGGVLVAAAAVALDTTAYLGLSLPLIDDALTGGGVVAYAFALKLLFTAVTLGAGFQGGEVTPLFVIGATAGAALAGPLGVDAALLASVGFVAVFAAATNTPLACTIMGIELFGPGALPYLAVGCVIAYVVSSHRGIYRAQRVATPKAGPDPTLAGQALRDLSHRRRREP